MTGPQVHPSEATAPAVRFAGGFAAGIVLVLFTAMMLFFLYFATAAVVIVVMTYPILLHVPLSLVLGPPLYLLVVGRRDRNAFFLGIGTGMLTTQAALGFVIWWVS